MTVRHAFAAATLTAAVLLLSASVFAGAASAAEATATAPTTSYKQDVPPKGSLGTYDLTWTLPTAGKSGCTVCHNDPDLVRVQGGKTVSLYVNTGVLQESAHKDVPCTGCHIDFAYKTPHSNIALKGDEWRAVAKSACKNCHPQPYADYTSSAHSPSGRPGEAPGSIGTSQSSAPGKAKPLCGDCHGGHSIPASNNVEAVRAVHLSGAQMCGQCHAKGVETYVDYYHGAAYKMSAPDAPSCWDCHSSHKVLASTNRESTVNKDRLIDTCKKCHADPRDGYVGYAELVHGKQAVLDANPLYAIVKSAQDAVTMAFGKVKSLFKRGSS